MLAALVGFLYRSVCTKSGLRRYARLTKHAIISYKNFRHVRHALQKHPETFPAHEVKFNPSRFLVANVLSEILRNFQNSIKGTKIALCMDVTAYSDVVWMSF